MKQPPDSFKCPLPSQHMASDIQHFFHTRIPDSVWTLQNVRIIKLMAINEGGEGGDKVTRLQATQLISH